MMFRTSPVVLCALFTACATIRAPQVDAGVRARVAVTLETDVASVDVVATPVDCVSGAPTGAAAQTGSAAFLALSLSDYELDLDPTVAQSEHDFADVFLLLEPGCYDVTAAPLQADGSTPSTDCIETGATGVEVFEGQTTEILLLSTCEGGASGGLDSIVMFNEEPTISDLAYDPSKFTDQCVATTVCVEATDPDGDPMDFEWTVTSGAADLVVTSFDQSGEVATECVEVNPTTGDDVELFVEVFDLLEDGTTVEAHLAANGVVAQSRDELTVPVHVAADDTLGADCQPVAAVTCPCFDAGDVTSFYAVGAGYEASGATYSYVSDGYITTATFTSASGGTDAYLSAKGAMDASGGYGRCTGGIHGSYDPAEWFPVLAPVFTGDYFIIDADNFAEIQACWALLDAAHLDR